MAKKKWPAYLPDMDNELRAVGAIATTFNLLEHRLLGLFLVYVGYGPPTATLFSRMRDNTMRLGMLMEYVNNSRESDDVKNRIKFFCDSYKQCADLRNFLMHASVLPLSEKKRGTRSIWFTKGAKNEALAWKRYKVSVDDLQDISDWMFELSEFGKLIHQHLVSTSHRRLLDGPFPLPVRVPLPDIPAPPKAMGIQFRPTNLPHERQP